ncbi:hypothetical protein FC093_15325 [Ilyomonas limi]|uniref:DUF4328 domain-containing protein n=1 Tax=Ilyomonas limi TaxID=2575867 RepID=A0A4U3KXR7_9BACT|nr:hypothetical protein [Ilyomonas limi]TKK67250.1 hypothetical protein FC093_15325 [Ilyomonas limi]
MGNLGFQELLLLAFVLVFMVTVILFLITLQNTLKAVEPENRTMNPGNVWLMLIPFFNAIWVFIVVNAIANSSQTQLELYGEYSGQKVTYNIGMAWAICSVLNWVPIIGLIAGFAALILFVVYWIKVNETRKQLLVLKQLHESREDASIL